VATKGTVATECLALLNHGSRKEGITTVLIIFALVYCCFIAFP